MDNSDDQELTAVLSPTIRSVDNQSIYNYSNLDYDKVISKGMISYAESMNGNVSRAGSNPLIIKATELDNDNSTPVLSKIDANKILIENQSSHFLDNCAVVFVSTRGIRDSYGGKRSGGTYSPQSNDSYNVTRGPRGIRDSYGSNRPRGLHEGYA